MAEYPHAFYYSENTVTLNKIKNCRTDKKIDEKQHVVIEQVQLMYGQTNKSIIGGIDYMLYSRFDTMGGNRTSLYISVVSNGPLYFSFSMDTLSAFS